ncbi:ATP-dependent RNA helicase DbpA [Xanthomonas graminis]|uniref:ATP-dependent RNA helicase DbpA n=2 Tax=Xanthomonas translucens group TaxID=3390202 RepID=A0A1M4IKP6_9XANT|nr:ATP-dependent RNA helicase DbpA [Xanthomonas translucens]OAX59728.1 ATP-dependent RNA helicase DbpA [Xanthomonas translucens pv. graminis]UKE52913.1 ATP-dependent RNA helicase DbpA [Xanthomonas translucens pv. graminis]WIH10199.1 ATP-dependent RNA helicase DbpA [Xanthomonas translucens pv. graminis]WIH13599.1 ATP-dependent RNA helicase DbpA [Xanthomonas translucens pv. graminis]WIH14722.1 ATP-dependent RNA helicase DbpA [Xanthomonas translucens pv. graminis]
MNDFDTLSLSPALAPGIDALGYTTMTPVQAQSLPPILAGSDVIVQAPTGSGKTAAFGLGLLHKLDPALTRAQALVLCPTRELADQVGKQLRKLATGIPNMKLVVLTGGMPLGPQLASLEAHDPQVVVGTPGRIQELARKRALHLGGVRTLVLDEGDRMLDMGFEEPIREIASRCDKHRQSLLFSATFPDAIRTLARELLQEPVEITIEGADSAPEIEQQFFEVDPTYRQKAVAGLLLRFTPESSVVFCNTRKEVDEVAGSLQQFGFSALALHGDMEQRDRDEVLVRFVNRSCNVLVASDVAARGLDVEDLAAVLNYELPTDTETYRHRIGRTARAGKRGLALSLVAPREVARAQALEAEQGQPLRWSRAPLATARPAQLPQAAMVTLRIDGGKTDKLRAGDILGALTGDAGLSGAAIGKIAIYATRSYVAIAREHAGKALAQLQAGKIKGRRFRVVKL